MYAISEKFRAYLRQNGREVHLPVSYSDLMRYTYSIPLRDNKGKDTYWETVMFDMREWNYLREGLVNIYATLKTEGDLSFTSHLDVARIDYCPFGNSHPFRIRIINKYNENYDHYYIKRADASRIYGLELEQILSPNRMTYFTCGDTLVEEHIPGVPGDVFIEKYLHSPETNQVRLAKEFVRFNERCFVRLLGDMRNYNFVVDITPDIEDVQYRIRAIDFDQQSYEGRRKMYMPQFFKENYPFVATAMKHLNTASISQYQAEERTAMAFRVAASRYRIMSLLDIMREEELSEPGKVAMLQQELAEYHKNPIFLKCNSMGLLVKYNMKELLQKQLNLMPRVRSRYPD